jgi:hypothetical protein
MKTVIKRLLLLYASALSLMILTSLAFGHGIFSPRELGIVILMLPINLLIMAKSVETVVRLKKLLT